MAKKFKRLLALVLTVAMVMGMMSTSVFAVETEPAPQATVITGTITEDTVWNAGDVIGGVTIADDVTITVNGTVTVAGTIRLGTDAICDVTFQGENDAKLIRGGDFTGQMFYVEGTICYFQDLIFNNITLDGGAVWTGEEDAILGRGTTNEGVKATGSVLYLVRANATLNNSTLQNHDDGIGEKANAVFLREYATVAFNNSVARYNNSPSGYWKGGVVTTRYGGSVTAKDSEVYGNSASYGGFVGISSSGSYGVKVECENTVFHNNYASTAGAVFFLQENGSQIAKTHGDNRSGYLKLTGCTLENNGSPDGLIHSYAYYMPAWIKDTTIANNACAVYTYGSNENRSFSVAGRTRISGEHSGSLYENPVRIYGALDSDASILMSEESVNHLMTQYGYLVTAAPAIPYDYNHTGKIQNAVIPYEYTSKAMYDLTLDELAQVELPENSGYTNWVLTDVDGNGMLDAVPVSAEPTTVNVTLVDNFYGTDETKVSKTVAVSNLVANVPVCEYEHAGHYFTGWAMEDGTLIKDAASAAILAEDAVLTATWAVARPVVSIAPKPYVIMLEVGDSVTLTASIDNENEQDLSYTYQWYREGAAIEDATDPVYTAIETDAGDYVYKCVVTATGAHGTNTYNKGSLLHYDVPAPKTAQLKIFKVDENGNALPGAEFEVFTIVDGIKTSIGTYAVDSKGELFIDLPVGSHVLVETKAPSGYLISSEEIEITVGEELDITVNDTKSASYENGVLTVVNRPPHAAVVLTIDMSGTMYRYKMDGQRYVNVAKAKALDFVEQYAETAQHESNKRMLAVARFDTDAKVVLNWVDVSTAEGLAAAKSAINGMKVTDNGSTSSNYVCTNFDGGVILTRNMLKQDAVDGIAKKFAIILSDGAPTVTVNNDTDTVGTIKSSFWGNQLRADGTKYQNARCGGGWTHPAEVDRTLSYLATGENNLADLTCSYQVNGEAKEGIFIVGVGGDMGVQLFYDCVYGTRNGSRTSDVKKKPAVFNYVDALKGYTQAEIMKLTTGQWLNTLAEKSGGTYESAKNSAALQTQFDNILNAIKDTTN